MDVSINGNLSVGTDLSLNGNLYVVKRAVFRGDVSMNGNNRFGSGSSSVAINKDISSAFALDVSGITQIRGNLDVAGTFTVNGAPISSSGGASLTGNVQVGTNNGFVSIDKPQFYADPSLTIYYNFDASINGGNGIKNIASATTLYDGSFNKPSGSTIATINTITTKYGPASLQNTTFGIPNAGLIVINSVPISTFMSFSMWVKKSELPGSTNFDRIFEFSNGATLSENDTIALDITNGGIIAPVLYNGTSNNCFNTLTSPFITYNICDNIWHHVVWTITSTASSIYIDGSIKHYDILNANPVPLGNRTVPYIAFSNRTGANYDFSGNIDEFRYYRDKALNYAEIYQLYNNKFYTFDICGGFLANGSSVIYEPSGSRATANSATLTLLHGDASGSSSIMFKSVNDPLEYGYIQYEENSTGSTGYHYGLMTIGIENDAGTGSYTSQADRVSLFPSGGTGFVGVNTKTPRYSLDVSGQMRIYEGAGTTASATNGSLTLEHAAVGGTSSLVFKASNSTSTSDYAYVQYQDATPIAQSRFKYDFSSNNPETLTGSANVASTGSNTTAMGFAPTDNSFAWFTTPGQIGVGTGAVTPLYCLSFNQTNLSTTNTSSRINYLQGSLGNFKSFSFSAWIRPTTIAPATGSGSGVRWMIANLHPGNANGVVDIWLEDNSMVFVLLGDDQNNFIRTTGKLSLDTWHHIVFTFDGDKENGYLYLNGNLDTFAQGNGLDGKALKANTGLMLGMKYGWNSGSGTNTVYTAETKFKGFRGQMAFVNVFNVPLTAFDVSYLYNNPGYTRTISDRGLMTIGIESETGYIHDDCISLFPGGGQGFVGINNKDPQYSLDVSGSISSSRTIFANAITSYSDMSSNPIGGGLIVNSIGTSGRMILGAYYTPGAFGSAIQSSDYYDGVDHGGPLFLNQIGGGVGIGRTNVSSGYLLDVNGSVQAASYNATSDYRIKTNVAPLDSTFNVDLLKPVYYNLKDDARLNIGFIAHEVQEVYPYLVSGEKDGKDTQSLNYNGLIGILTKEIQVLKKKVADQEAKALEQSAKALDQETRIQALEKMVFDLINK